MFCIPVQYWISRPNPSPGGTSGAMKSVTASHCLPRRQAKYAIAMIAGLAATGTAGAADLLPPPPPLPEPPSLHVGGGFYLRGYIGMTNQQVDHLDNALFVPADTITWPRDQVMVQRVLSTKSAKEAKATSS